MPGSGPRFQWLCNVLGSDHVDSSLTANVGTACATEGSFTLSVSRSALLAMPAFPMVGRERWSRIDRGLALRRQESVPDLRCGSEVE